MHMHVHLLPASTIHMGWTVDTLHIHTDKLASRLQEVVEFSQDLILDLDNLGPVFSYTFRFVHVVGNIFDKFQCWNMPHDIAIVDPPDNTSLFPLLSSREKTASA